MKGAAGPESTPSSNAGKAPDAAAPLRPPTDLPAKNEANVAAAGQGSSVPANAARASKLPPEFLEQFKDVTDASSIPPEGASAPCAEFTEGLSRDWDTIMQTMRDLAESKKKGSLGVLAYLKGFWMLKSVAWVAFRHETGPEQCVKEFDKEYEKRFEAMTKEVNALTEEVKDK